MRDDPDSTQRAHPRQPWGRSDRPVPRRVVRPLVEFFHAEAAGGIVLLLAALLALLWVNGPFGDSYEKVWHTELTFRLGSWEVTEDLRHWINDALMSLFFFVVGLEIKRELVRGELQGLRVAAMPALAALGGMTVPALIYTAFNAGTDAASGWGIPMATDIAFAVGVVAIFGRLLPTSVKVFLLALAIVDDIGAILVIAVFYTPEVSVVALVVAGALVGAIVASQRMGIRAMHVYLILGVGVWAAVFSSGVHATIAGVLLGLLTPSRPFQSPEAVPERVIRAREEQADAHHPDDVADEWLGVSAVSREAVSPLARLELGLHPWTSFLIVPLFALANAGVELNASTLGGIFSDRVTLGIVLGLVAGNAIGIPLLTWLGTRSGIGSLPEGATWPQIGSVAFAAGIGFTVSIFIAGLAFGDGPRLASAKVGILVGSLVAGVLGALALRLWAPRGRAEEA